MAARSASCSDVVSMTSPTPSDYPTRDQVLKLLSEGEAPGFGTDETTANLRKGDEYLDLEQLQQGVQRAPGVVTLTGYVLPRKAIHEDTWRRILRQLKAAPL